MRLRRGVQSQGVLGRPEGTSVGGKTLLADGTGAQTLGTEEIPLRGRRDSTVEEEGREVGIPVYSLAIWSRQAGAAQGTYQPTALEKAGARSCCPILLCSCPGPASSVPRVSGTVVAAAPMHGTWGLASAGKQQLQCPWPARGLCWCWNSFCPASAAQQGA